MQFTPEQSTAVYTHDKNLIVVAGAGSGKTRVLVERYLAMLEANPDWPLTALVAITFTKEAALEMTNRVRERLEQRLHEVELAVKPRWQTLLSQMDSARIGTIHSLCGDILRANAAEAGLDPGFEVMDEIQSAMLLDTIVSDVFNDIARFDPDGLLRLFTQYDERTIRDVARKIDLLAQDFSIADADPTDLLADWQQQWDADCHKAAKTARDLIDAHYHEPPDPTDKLSAHWLTVAASRDALDQPPDGEAIYSAITQLTTVKLNVGSKKVWGDAIADIKADLRAIREWAEERKAELGEQPPAGSDQAAAELVVLWARLLRRVADAYTHAKRSAGALDFNDLEVLTARLLSNFPDVRARYCTNEFRHVLVDEFQDTNQAQWEIVHALTDLEQGGSLFVVGDPKQSIYGFRGADVSVFNHVKTRISQRECGQQVALSQSFRTHNRLVQTFNTLFDHILTTDADSPVHAYQVAFDEPMSAFRQESPDDPSLELLLLNDQPPDGYEAKSVLAEDRRQWEAYEIGLRLQHMVDRQTLVFDKSTGQQRPIRYGDMAILMRALTGVTIYEDVFKVLGIPYVTLAGRGYYARQEVWDVLNLLRSLHNPADNLSLAAALRSPLFGFSDELLFILRRLKNAPDDYEPMRLWDTVQLAAHDTTVGPLDAASQQVLTFADRVLRELHALAGRVTIAELIRLALAQTGYLAVLQALQPDGVRRRRNVEKLLNIAEESGLIALSEFTIYMDDLSDRDLREGEALLDASDAVQIMSIHKSKGLEFPVVVLADVGGRSGSRSLGIVAYDRDLGLSCKFPDEDGNDIKPYPYRKAERLQTLREEAESRRLLYVAATRAQDRLIVSGGATIKDGSLRASHWLGWLLDALQITEQAESQSLVWSVPNVDDCSVRVTTYQYDLGLRDQLIGGREAPEPLSAEGQPQMPPLLQSIPQRPDALLMHMAASQLENLLGSVRDSERNNLFRTNLMSESADIAHAPIREVVRTQMPRITRRMIGLIVHEALRYWRMPDNTPDIDAVLRSYAWQQGVTDSRLINVAVQDARQLLDRFMRSELYHWIAAAKAEQHPVYHELPFIYQLNGRLIHGMVDLVFQRTDGSWCVVDYKTSYVKGAPQPEAFSRHAAHHYHLQMGAYAQALSEQFAGQAPEVYVHYVRYVHSVHIHEDAWRSALNNLESLVQAALN